MARERHEVRWHLT